MVEWPITTDCKSVAFGLRGFESLSTHKNAHVAQAAEHILGKNEVRSANLRVGSMKNSKILIWGVIDSLGAFIYILTVAYLMFNGEKIFGEIDNFLGPAALLLLFVLSATIVGSLVLGRPVYLYLNGFKKEAVKLLIYTIGCLFYITFIIFLTRLKI